MSHNHSHDHRHIAMAGNPEDTRRYLGKAFIAGIVLNLLFVVVEFIAGLILGSVALISDAGHNLSDVISLALALMAFRLALVKSDGRYTYGRKKVPY